MKMNFRKAATLASLCTALMMGGTVQVFAADVAGVEQSTKKVSGLVVDQTGEAVIGASVLEKGTTNGTVTDFDGKFSLQVKPGATLVISYVGMATQEVKVGSQSTINVKLAEDSELLDDVVVVGYGTMKKSDISGSVATVDREAMLKRVPVNIGQALQGSAAGVVVTQQDGAPDANSAIRIRGVGTINGTAQPLYVVDGVQVGNSADFLNPSDIESVQILKDASATAIYGAAGGNGVVMITTNHGSKGVSNVNITADLGIQTLAYKLKTLGIDDFAASIREARKNDGAGIYNLIWGEEFDGKRNYIDWQDQMTNPALRQQYGVSMNGGNDKTQYNFSVGYLNYDGLVVNTNFQRLTARANVKSNINKFLEVGGDMNFVHSQSHGSNSGIANNGNLSSQRDYATMSPTLDYKVNNAASGEYVKVNIVNPDGTYGTTYQNTSDGWEGNTQIFGNVYASQMENGERNRNGNDQVMGSGYADLIFINNKVHKLDLKGLVNATYWGNNSSDYTGGRSRYNTIGGKLSEIALVADQSYAFSMNQSSGYSIGTQAYLTYELTTDNHHLTLMGGAETGNSWGQWVNASAREFLSESNRSIAMTLNADSKQCGGAYNADVHTISYFARGTYSLLDRYILTGTIRRDGSSNFGPGNRWGTFPSAAFAWRLSEEPFMQGVEALDNLKLRAGWGQVGNAGNMTGKAIAALSGDAAYAFYPANGESGAWGNRNRQTGLWAPLVDTNLKWETNETLNFGIDFGFLNSFSGSVEYFVRTTKDLLLYQQVRPSTGFTQVYTNYGSIQNKGFEFELNYRKQLNRNWGISASVNGSTLNNKVIQMGDPLFNTCSGGNDGSTIDGSNVQAVGGTGFHWENHSICKEGYAVGSFYGYTTDGIIRDEADLKDYLSKVSLSEGEATVGDYKWKDIAGGFDKDGNPIPDGIIDENDMSVLGNGFAKLNYGLNLGATYKNWDLSVYMYGALGQKILSYSAMRMSTMFASDDQTTANILQDAYKSVFRAGNEANATLPRLSMIDKNYNMRVSDAWVMNGNFLRISNIQIGYNLPRDFARSLYIQNARVYASVQNLAIFSPYKKYGDPECGQGSVFYTGLDTGRYPMPRTFMAGVNVTF